VKLNPQIWAAGALAAALATAGCTSATPAAATTVTTPATTTTVTTTPATPEVTTPVVTTPVVTTPEPPKPTFQVTGTVSETAPTASRRVSAVQVAIAGGPAATTDAGGVFTLTGVLAGTHTVTLSKADYTTQAVTVTVGSSNVSGVQVNLSPSPLIISEIIDTSIAPGPPCSGSTKTCHIYPTGAHHEGRVRVFVVWSTDDTDLDLELWCNDRLLKEQSQKAGTIDEINELVPGGQACHVRVVLNGAPQRYRIFLDYPR
jgi:hypothetical protein